MTNLVRSKMSGTLSNDVSATAETELVVFENSGHFFDDHLNELREAVKDWTEKQIATPR